LGKLKNSSKLFVCTPKGTTMPIFIKIWGPLPTTGHFKKKNAFNILLIWIEIINATFIIQKKCMVKLMLLNLKQGLKNPRFYWKSLQAGQMQVFSQVFQTKPVF
jgi:hypothetical protein